MNPFRKLWNDFFGKPDHPNDVEVHYSFMVTNGDVEKRSAEDFELHVSRDVKSAGGNSRGTQSPWEVLMMYVITLEKRVKELEAK